MFGNNYSLKYEGTQVRKGNRNGVENFNKFQYFRSCLMKHTTTIKGFNIG